MPLSQDQGPDEAGLLAEINVTPFIDVMLVLLIIFMVAAPLMMAGVPLNLPKAAATPLPQAQGPLVVSMDRQGKVFLGQEEVASGALGPRLAQALAGEPGRSVQVRCDKGLEYGRIMDLLSRLGQAGASRILLVSEGS